MDTHTHPRVLLYNAKLCFCPLYFSFFFPPPTPPSVIVPAINSGCSDLLYPVHTFSCAVGIYFHVPGSNAVLMGLRIPLTAGTTFFFGHIFIYSSSQRNGKWCHPGLGPHSCHMTSLVYGFCCMFGLGFRPIRSRHPTMHALPRLAQTLFSFAPFFPFLLFPFCSLPPLLPMRILGRWLYLRAHGCAVRSCIWPSAVIWPSAFRVRWNRRFLSTRLQFL